MADGKKGAPAWMISFGDMMTLILTFFILLVSMSEERQEGLVAKGVGSFMVALRSFGLPGVLDKDEESTIFEGVRSRFNLPPEDDPELQTEHLDASDKELLRAKAAQALAPHDEINQPAVAVFEPGSAELTDRAGSYLDLLASTLQPRSGQVLLLEGHAGPTDLDRGAPISERYLAFRRARTVADYLIEEHGLPARRVQARAWLAEIDEDEATTRSVDARLVIPSKEDD